MARSEVPLPDYWIPQPPMQLDEAARLACDTLLAAAVAQGPEQPFAYPLNIPKWQFLSYITERHNLALHGSGSRDIRRFEPRQPVDLQEFGAQKAVYAAADGIWPLYFAIVDRSKSPSIINACIYPERADGTMGDPYYFFSISRQAVDRQPYQDGVVYLLPRDTFIRQPAIEVGAWRIHVAQLASLEAVAPLAKLAVTPEDFPFLAQMRTHDDARLAEYAEAMNRGLPWPQD
ncbi:MAG: hypothetical protein IT328_21285 [Caldilineaceae bacterium]|nr:hypothetical protein [Caldilineaceae bacterium]